MIWRKATENLAHKKCLVVEVVTQNKTIHKFWDTKIALVFDIRLKPHKIKDIVALGIYSELMK